MKEEGAPDQEQIPSKEEILARLRLEGMTDENRALVLRWTESRRKEVVTPKDALTLNFEGLDFYIVAVDREGELEHARDVFENAFREGEEDICDILIELYGEENLLG